MLASSSENASTSEPLRDRENPSSPTFHCGKFTSFDSGRVGEPERSRQRDVAGTHDAEFALRRAVSHIVARLKQYDVQTPARHRACCRRAGNAGSPRSQRVDALLAEVRYPCRSAYYLSLLSERATQ